jgi:hypothetical protein
MNDLDTFLKLKYGDIHKRKTWSNFPTEVLKVWSKSVIYYFAHWYARKDIHKFSKLCKDVINETVDIDSLSSKYNTLCSIGEVSYIHDFLYDITLYYFDKNLNIKNTVDLLWYLPTNEVELIKNIIIEELITYEITNNE